MSPEGCGKVRPDLTLPQPSTNVVITLCASWVAILDIWLFFDMVTELRFTYSLCQNLHNNVNRRKATVMRL